MERISEELRLGSLKKDALGKAFEKLNCQAPSFLLFSVQWKDLDDLYDSISKSLHDLAKSLYEREASLEERSKEKELSQKEGELLSPAAKMEECGRSIEVRPKDVNFRIYQRASSRKQLQILEGEISTKKDGMISREDLLDGVVGGKEKELSSAGEETNGEQLCTELGLKKQSLEVQIATLLNEVRAAEDKLLSLSKELEDKEGRLQLVQQSLEEHSSKLELKRTEFDQLTESIASEQRMIVEKRDQCFRDIKSREQQYYSLKVELETRSEILASNDKEFEQRMEEFKLRQQEFAQASSAQITEIVSISSMGVPRPQKGKKKRPNSLIDEKSIDHPQPKLRRSGRLSAIVQP